MKNLAFLAAAVGFALPVAAVAADAAAREGGEVMFVSGHAQRFKSDGSQEAVNKGMQVAEGDRIQTQPDSHVYVRLRDGGLLVVRPASELKVERWRYDPAQPQDSQIKYMLESGVARHVSGKGAKAARDKFRFNTPLAAIGVRGTDFTVLADQAVTRVAVRSGGVIVSGLGNGCRAEGTGPCEGDSAVELFANASDRLLQVRQGERRPELIERDKRDTPAPDNVRPPAVAEPVAKARSGDTEVPDVRKADKALAAAQSELAELQNPPPTKVPEVGGDIAVPQAPTPFTAAVWGRWSVLTDVAAATTTARQIMEGRTLVGTSDHFILAANRPATPLELPGSGTASFKLLGHEGVLFDNVSRTAVSTTAGDGTLSIDFGKRTFATSLPIKAESLGISTTIRAVGEVESDGKFLQRSHVPATNSLVSGIVGGPNASEAAYLYQQDLSERHKATGVTSWRK